MTKDNQNFASGTIIDGKYCVEQLIGSGGTSEVYESTQLGIGRKVAVKILRSQYTHKENAVARFQQESRLAGSIGHDHICEVTDFGIHEGKNPYLVMPLLSGVTLAGLLKQEPLPILRFIDIICQVLSSLKAAHQANIVHRDLKPSNIFITKVGNQEDFVKLLDFGISKVLDADSTNYLTKTGTIPGTAFYMSPEQAVGSKNIDYRVDIYAIGVILYEALTGTLPFEGDSYNEIMHKIITEPFIAPRRIRPATPKLLEDVVLTAMSRDPMKRFSNADEMRKSLEQTIFDGLSDFEVGNVEVLAANRLRSQETFTANPNLPAVGTLSPQSSSIEKDNAKVVKNRFSTIAIAALVLTVIAAFGITGFLYWDETTPYNASSLANKPQKPTPIVLEDSPKKENPQHTLKIETETEPADISNQVVSSGHDKDAQIETAPKVAKKNNLKKKKKPITVRQKKPSKPTLVSHQKDKTQKKLGSEEIKGRFGSKIYLDYDD
ncbi:MAG: serine/threonine protein kinase [Proteobacteria bacterium]|nr:serine/threonine protein kinase [Pseudomonadota bacterium]